MIHSKTVQTQMIVIVIITGIAIIKGGEIEIIETVIARTITGTKTRRTLIRKISPKMTARIKTSNKKTGKTRGERGKPGRYTRQKY